MSSSMKLLHSPMSKHGLVVIPKQQISGIGKINIIFILYSIINNDEKIYFI